MCTTHELGHLVGGYLGGATLIACDLRPWRLPYSLFDPDPYPLLTLWLGPILGVLVPAFVAAVIRTNWMHLIASFCVLANGAYLTIAWLVGDRYLDTPAMLAHGANPLYIAIYCAVTVGTGYYWFKKSCLAIFHPPPVGTSF